MLSGVNLHVRFWVVKKIIYDWLYLLAYDRGDIDTIGREFVHCLGLWGAVRLLKVVKRWDFKGSKVLKVSSSMSMWLRLCDPNEIFKGSPY